jgi:hypothetical protein
MISTGLEKFFEGSIKRHNTKDYMHLFKETMAEVHWSNFYDVLFESF